MEYTQIMKSNIPQCVEKTQYVSLYLTMIEFYDKYY